MIKKISVIMIVIVLSITACTSNANDTASTSSANSSLLSSSQVNSGESGVESKDQKPISSAYKFVDCHLHYLDFLQRTDGFDKLIEAMDRANVEKAVLFGMPITKQWDQDAPNEPSYYLSNDSRAYYYSATDYIMMEQLSKQSEEVKNRFLPFVCGVNPNDKNASKYIRQTLETYPNTFCGIGEIMSRHDDLTALTYGEPPRADSEALKNIYDLAAEFKMPVLIHHNIAASYTDDPIYLEEMKNALAHNRGANIIWAHMGISRRVEISNLIDIFREMFNNNPNLYVDISWVVYDDYISVTDDSLKQFASLIEEYPDRMMIGTDIVGHWSNYENTIKKYESLLNILNKETAEKLCRSNILKLIKKY